MTVEIGQLAPDFTLRDGGNNPKSLAELRDGRKTLLVFIPFPFSGTCTEEVCAIRDDLASLSGLDTNVVVVTCDTRWSNARWAEDNGLSFPVLSDFWPHGAVCQLYGCFNEGTGTSWRWSYVLDAEGVVRQIVKSEGLGQAREYEEYKVALATI